ncbi:MAG: hypothetical protein ACRDHZ_01925 [Ktedonobacteraceae bacterium]
MMLIKGIRQTSSWLASLLLVLLMFTLAACGTNSLTSTGSPAAPSATSAPTATATHSSGSTSTGCPNSTPLTTEPAAASVVLKISDEEKTTTVKKGATLEVDLPFGHNWSGPANKTQSPLAMQDPSGYASPASQMCVWHFVATSTGTTNLLFTGRPICAKNQICPLYIMALSFPITVQ